MFNSTYAYVVFWISWRRIRCGCNQSYTYNSCVSYDRDLIRHQWQPVQPSGNCFLKYLINLFRIFIGTSAVAHKGFPRFGKLQYFLYVKNVWAFFFLGILCGRFALLLIGLHFAFPSFGISPMRVDLGTQSSGFFSGKKRRDRESWSELDSFTWFCAEMLFFCCIQFQCADSNFSPLDGCLFGELVKEKLVSNTLVRVQSHTMKKKNKGWW